MQTILIPIAAYVYDDLHRLTSATITNAADSNNYTRTYTYSVTGNINTKSDVGTYSYNNIHPHAVTSDGTNTYTYDNNGSLTGDGTWTHTYDTRNRLTQSADGSSTISYTYDEGRTRMTKSDGVATTTYVNDYFEKEGATEKLHVRANNLKIATIDDRDDIFHHEDHLTGSSVETDSNGDMIELVDYYPYGSVRIDDGTYDNNYKFTGKELDDETDLYYYGSRYYNSTLGRFTSVDPWKGDLKDPQSFNKYSYVRNNPLRYVDPSGETWLDSLVWSGLKTYFEAKDYNLSAELLNYSVNWDQILPFQGPSEKKGLYFNTNSSDVFSQELGEEIRGTSAFNKITDKIRNYLSNGKLSSGNDNLGSTFDKEDNADLYYAIRDFDYSFNATELEDGSYDVNISITDTYDYDWEIPTDLTSLGIDVASWSQSRDALQTYSVEINMQENIQIEKEDDNN